MYRWNRRSSPGVVEPRVSFGKSETVGSEKKYTVFCLEHDFFLLFIDFCTILLTGSDSRAARNNSGQGFEKNYFFQFCHFFSPSSKIFRKLLIILLGPFPGTPAYILKIFSKFNIFHDYYWNLIQNTWAKITKKIIISNENSTEFWSIIKKISPAAGTLPGDSLSGEQSPTARCAGA